MCLLDETLENVQHKIFQVNFLCTYMKGTNTTMQLKVLIKFVVNAWIASAMVVLGTLLKFSISKLCKSIS